MKTKTRESKNFDTVKVFREIKEKIALDTEKMNFEQFQEYLSKNQLKPAQ